MYKQSTQTIEAAGSEAPAVQTAPCTAYTWCTATGTHHDHISADHTIADTRGAELLGARVLYLSGSTPTIGIGESDFTPDQARVKANELRQMANTVDDLASKAQRASGAARTWTYTRRPDGAKVTVTCPTWCGLDHENAQYLGSVPEEIGHTSYGKETHVWATDSGKYEQWCLLQPELSVFPDAEDDEAVRRVPYVVVQLVDDVWSREMGPEELTEFIATVEGQLTELRTMHTRLVAARAEWDTQTPPDAKTA